MAQLITLMTASIISAALNDIASDLQIGMTSAQMIFSTYFLGLGFGPFVVAAFSEIYGRKWIWVVGNIWYILWNAISPVGRSAKMMIVSRLMAGLGACAGVTVCLLFSLVYPLLASLANQFSSPARQWLICTAKESVVKPPPSRLYCPR